jgi:hypothetical protein
MGTHVIVEQKISLGQQAGAFVANHQFKSSFQHFSVRRGSNYSVLLAAKL